MSIRLLLYGVLGVAALGIGTVAMLPGAPPAASAGPAAAPPPPARVAVLVAARPVQGGVLLKPEDIGSAQIPVPDLPEGAIRDTPTARADAIGAMVRRTVSKDEVLRPEVMLRPGDHGFLAAVLGPGMRAVTVGVDAVSGTAGLIWPGDRVDLILTQALDDDGGGRAAPGRRVVGETVLSAVRVIAVDRSLVQGAQPGGLADGVRADSNRTVTLEVSPDEATRVSVASRLGRLSLSVRAAGTPVEVADVAGARTAVWASDVSAAFGRAPAAPAAATPAAAPAPAQPSAGGGATVRIFKGTAEVEEIRFR